MKLLTVTEFAERAGVTPQAIYKRLKTDLEPFLVVENGAKKLSDEALSFYTSSIDAKQTSREQELLERIAELESLVEQLTQDKVELLTKIAADKEKLWNFAERLAQMQENAQILIAQNTQVVSSLTQLSTSEVEETTKVEEVDTNSKKPSLISRLFKRH